ncbi:OmpH family outer membrane protein [Rubellimicrobium rubrum]|uniref:OmpH family outer membrane protein n=1 Tax=Rubellimicrobium rubrum TaxID=2585369 RepID=A0A5C4N055_9RHOB|nr:OmpH family outer membrane protein [Rubellimicrobium rubrum]TNC51127.1 OmpH family outer membrane protein [Rubellimicrobium rubrum]
MHLRALIAAALLALVPDFGVAQDDLSMGRVQSPVLTIDVDRLLAETQFGQRISDDLRERTEALSAENERLRLQLTTEERSLTDRRPTMEVEDFRTEADAFDARVQTIRAQQDAKQRDLEEAVARGREEFLNSVRPVLVRLMLDSGAAVILERRDVFLSVGLVDVTDEAIAAMDAQLGDGASPLPVEPPSAVSGPASGPTEEAEAPGRSTSVIEPSDAPDRSQPSEQAPAIGIPGD